MWPARMPAATYRVLEEPVVLPLKMVSRAWHPVPFTARAKKGGPAGAPARDVLLKGILLREPAGLRAYCLICPHELCYLNFVPGGKTLVCPCHDSVFNLLEDGARISGPAPRGAYRFRLRVRGNRVEIREVEEEALA